MKKKLLALLIVAVMCIFCGCAENTTEEQSLGGNDVYIYVDEKTGVNYFIYDGYYSGGMTMRYNADGTIYVTP